jgi:hypothetical protein
MDPWGLEQSETRHSGCPYGACSQSDQVQQVADCVDFRLRKQHLWTLGDVTEWLLIETGGIHDASACELINDGVDVADLVGGVSALCEIVGEDLLGCIAIQTNKLTNEKT